MNTYETYLPIFPGFYNTSYEPDELDLIYSINQERKEKGLHEIDYNDLQIDYDNYENDVVTNFSDALQSILKDYVKSIKIQKIIHPHYYNFKNDSVDVMMEVYPNKIQEFIYNHKELFIQFLKTRYTSRDGFISHYDNTFKNWQEDTKNFINYSINGHYLGSILEFIFYTLQDETKQNLSENLMYDVLENVYIDSYVENYDNVMNKIDDSLKEYLIINGYNKNYAEYLNNTFVNGNINLILLDEKTSQLINQYKLNNELITS